MTVGRGGGNWSRCEGKDFGVIVLFMEAVFFN